MATTGAKAPTAVVTAAETPWEDNDWTTPQNIYGAGEASVTAATFDAGDQTYVLKAYTFDMSTIPDGSTINGVICVINARYATAPASIDLVQLLDASRSKVGDNKAATPQALTNSAADYTFGTSTNVWGNALDTTWVKDTDFGVAIGCLAGGSGNNNVDVYIDTVTLEVYYTANAIQSLNAAAITASGESVSVVPGAVAPSVNVAALVATPQAVSIDAPVGGTDVSLGVASLTVSPQAVAVLAYTPATAVLDSFTRSDGTLGTNWGGQMWSGELPFRVSANKAVPSGLLFLGVSANGRYLVDGSGSPWLMIGDSPQGMISNLTPAQMETYMANREGYGINLIQVHLLSGATFGGNSTTFAAQDGTTPFTTTGDIRTPRETYFAQVDDLINLAASHNMIVMLTAAEDIDAVDLFTARTVAECRTFGQYLGNRYKDFPNLIWNFGNDYITGTAAVDDAYQAVQAGIRDYDSNHLHTVWLLPWQGGSEESSRENAEWNALVDIDFVYLYYTTYQKCLEDYALAPAMPLFLGESNYESEELAGYTTLPLHIRKQHYWSLLSGACGTTYCNIDIWHFLSGWATRLDSYPGLTHTEICANLFNSVSWWQLVPDNAHDVLTAGYGTYDDTEGSIDTNDYATCAYLADGSLAMIYMPTNRTMTVDCTEFTGTFSAKWFDPTNGTYTDDAASPVENTGTHQFSRASTNSAGDSDWVLVLSV